MLPEISLKIPSRRPALAAAGRDLLAEFRRELAEIKQEVDTRENGYGLQGLVNGLTDGLFPNTGMLPDTQAGPWTLSGASAYVPVSLNRILLSYSYMSVGLLRTVVDVPVDDAFRGGVRFKTDELDEKELKQLNTAFKRKQPSRRAKGPLGMVNRSAGYNTANSDLDAVKMTLKWARLYGGSGLIVNTDQDFRRELDPERIKPDSPLSFIAADRWELVLGQTNIYGDSPTPFNYYGLPLHFSRVVKTLGSEAPSYIRLRLQGWGMSVLEECLRAVNTYIKFENLLFELLDEAKIDIYKIKGLNTALATDSGTQRIQRRVTLANQLKNYQNALSMDAEDDYHQKQLSFSGLAEIKEGLRTDLCAYLRFPKNKLFGESAGGFSSGKDSLDNYNMMVEHVRASAEPLLLDAGELRCQQMFGLIPEDLEIVWTPLDVLDGVEQEAVKTAKQNRVMQKFQSGLLTGQEASQELRREELQGGDETEVEQGLREVDPLAMAGGEGGGDGEKPLPRVDPRSKTPQKVPSQGATSHE